MSSASPGHPLPTFQFHLTVLSASHDELILTSALRMSSFMLPQSLQLDRALSRACEPQLPPSAPVLRKDQTGASCVFYEPWEQWQPFACRACLS